MASIAELFTTALQHHQAGELAVAEQGYCQVLSGDPRHADSHHLLGVIAFQTGRHESAVTHICRAIGLNDNEPAFHSNLGNVYKALGKLDEAATAYRRALEIHPELPEAHNNLAAVFQAQGRHDLAVASFRKALALRPDYAEVHSNLGVALFELRRFDDAVACYRRALDLKPADATAQNNLGNALRAQGKLEEAIASYHRALELKPDFAAAHSNLGNVLQVQGKFDESRAAYQRALELNPDNAEARNNLGQTLVDQGRLDDAIDCFHRALNLKPDFAEAYTNLGNAFKEQGRLDQALAAYASALEVKPDHVAASVNRLFALWYVSDLDFASIHEQHRRWNRQWAAPLASDAVAHTNNVSPHRRLRIGYVSPDFRRHCQAFFTAPLFAAHDREQVEIVCYADVADPDDVTARLRSCTDRWRSIVGKSDDEVDRLIRQDQIDILVDLTMHMGGGRWQAFARKPAPVQVCWLAYPGTTGLETIDYRLTDAFLDPPGMNDHYYSERSVRLPDCFWCYDPLLAEKPTVASLPALASEEITFGCLNNFCKVNALVLKLWARVLSAVPRSRLLLLVPEGSARRQVLDVMAQAGVAAERIHFVARQARWSYLQLYHQIDIGLDTFPYNGHTTSLDSFWMGVPVITLVGQTVVGRAGLCQLHNLGLPELIAETPEQFVEIAAGLAADLPRLVRLRSGLRERMEKSPLMDTRRFARNIEAAYRQMWHNWCGTQALPK